VAGEFDLIANYFNWPNEADSVHIGVGDDAAVLNVTPDHQLVISVDTLVAGVHYPHSTSPEDIGYKSLIVNLSDIAAMGAEPKWFTLALTLPDYDSEWLTGFSAGLKQAATDYGVSLIGGDTTRGAQTISIQIMGEVATGKALKRSAAQVGDSLYITNTLGDAAAGLQIHQANQASESLGQLSASEAYCVARLNRPTARVIESRVIRKYANACMDISDGLLQDLSHILQASKLGAVIDTAAIRLSPELASLYSRKQGLQFALGGGDDYELLFSVSQEKRKEFEHEMLGKGLDFQLIGKLVAITNDIRDQNGNLLKALGFQHF